jgi:hypothetical protein
MIADIVNFLVPTSEAIQVTFFTVIASGVAISVLWVLSTAREAAWERKWQGGAAGAAEGLDIEHGSVSELSQAVATRGEKIAAMMPGLLLIIGLLGTFLGLGMALDKASAILQSSGNSVGAMDDSMQNLMSMMQGLGTKFKTSTWGIIAFILLKLWESSNGFEDRRLNWCIKKIKAELAQHRSERELAKQASEDKLQDSIRGAAKLVVATLNVQTDGLKSEWARGAQIVNQLAERRNDQWLLNFDKFNQQFGQQGAALAQLVEQASDHTTLLKNANEQTGQLIALGSDSVRYFEAFDKRLIEHGLALAQLVQQSDGHTLLMKEVNGQASQLVALGGDYVGYFDAFSLQFIGQGATLAGMSEQAVSQTALMQRFHEQNGRMIELAEGSEAQLVQFTRDSRKNIEKLSEAASTMQVAAGEVAESAAGLKGAVGTLENELKGTLDAIASNLDRTISQMGDELSKATQGITKSTLEMSATLGTAVDEMKQGLENSVGLMSEKLTGAADKISLNVGTMETTLDRVLTSMQGDLKTAFAQQAKGLMLLGETSQAVSETSETMKGELLKLGDRIASGLDSISTNNRKMNALVNTFEDVSKSLQGLPQQLETVNSALSKSFQIVPQKMDEFAQAISANTRYNQALESLHRVHGLVEKIAQARTVSLNSVESLKEAAV